MRWRTKGILLSAGLIAALFAWAAFARAFAPAGNTDRSRFDAIIVLGSPANAEGNPTPIQLGRVIEGVHEYERGVAPRLILTGGPTRHGYVEAHVMARTAQAMGVPASSIFEDPQAMDTIQNACYSVRIMQAHGWRSAEVVSSASHLPRAGLIFTRHPLEWRSHAAPSLEPQGTISRCVFWSMPAGQKSVDVAGTREPGNKGTRGRGGCEAVRLRACKWLILRCFGWSFTVSQGWEGGRGDPFFRVADALKCWIHAGFCSFWVRRSAKKFAAREI
jgi:uncharacterized SAM-binding protein YcdF (DUF218 family)